MREIEIVGPADDERFVLARDRHSPETFHVVADHRLRSLYSAGTVPATPQERPMNPLSPREIQSRIRHGAGPDELAEASDTPLERIMAFAVPVLAEREHIAERARDVSVRRRYADGATTLQEALRAQLTSGRLDDAAWDAWRRDDGRWTVSVTFDGGEPATFVYDTQGRYVVADSVHARTMIGDTDDASPDMALAQALVEAGASNELVDELAAPQAPVEGDQEVVEEVEAIEEAVTAEPADSGEPAEIDEPLAAFDEVSLGDLFDDDPPAGVASLKRARDRRAMGQLALGGLEEYAESTPEPVPEAEPEPEPVSEPEPVPEPEPVAQVTEAPEPETEETGSRKRERRRVPTWDEIMFGNSSST